MRLALGDTRSSAKVAISVTRFFVGETLRHSQANAMESRGEESDEERPLASGDLGLA
jgi:hypothetical protein